VRWGKGAERHGKEAGALPPFPGKWDKVNSLVYVKHIESASGKYRVGAVLWSSGRERKRSRGVVGTEAATLQQGWGGTRNTLQLTRNHGIIWIWGHSTAAGFSLALWCPTRASGLKGLNPILSFLGGHGVTSSVLYTHVFLPALLWNTP